MNATGESLKPSQLLSQAWADLRSCWAVMAGTALIYVALATVILLPSIGALFRFLIHRTHSSAIADVDIARFLLSTVPGVVALILVTALIIAVTAIEQACLMYTGLGRVRGVVLRVRDAFEHVARRVAPILILTILLVVRVLILIAPFAAAIAAVYWIVLRQYDINYYLAARPAAFWSAVAAVGVVTLALAALLLRQAVRWILILPLVVFEKIRPAAAFGESARRIRGHARIAAFSLAIWALLALGLTLGATPVMQGLGRLVAPVFGQSMAGMLIFVGVIAVTWLTVIFAINTLLTALFALICARLYARTEPPGDRVLPRRSTGHLIIGER